METEKIIAELIKAEKIADKHDILISSFCQDTDVHTFVDSCKNTYHDFDTDGETNCLIMYFGQYLVDVLFGPTTKTKDFLTLIFNYELAAKISNPIDMVFHVCGYDLVKQDSLMTKLKESFFGEVDIKAEFEKHILHDKILNSKDGYSFDADIIEMIINGELVLNNYPDGSKQLFDIKTKIFYSKDYLPLMTPEQYVQHKEILIHKQ